MKGGDSLVPSGTRESFVRAPQRFAQRILFPRKRAPRAQHCIRLPIFAVGNLRPAATAPYGPPAASDRFNLRLMSAIAPLISDLAIILVAAGCSTLVFRDCANQSSSATSWPACWQAPSVSFIPTVSDASSIRVGRHRRHLPAFRHGTRILVPQTAERGRHGRHGRRDDRGGNDVRGVRNGHVAGFLPHEQHFPGRDALDVVDGDRLQGLRRHGAARTALHGRGAGHPRGRGSGGRRADGAALDAGREQAVRRRRDAGQHPQTGSLPDLLVAAGHLPDPHAAQTAATAAQRRNAAHRGARPVSGDGDDRRQGRFLGCTRRLRHGIAPGRNGRSRTDHTTGRTGQEPLRRDLLRLGRHDDRTGAARALRWPHRAAHGRSTRRTGDFRHARRARIGTTAARSRAVGILAHAGRRVRLHHSHPGHDATRDRRLPLSRHRGRIGRHDLPDAP